MLVHPQFDPVALQLGPVAVRWYGLMYLLGFALIWLLGRYRIDRNPGGVWTRNDLDDVLFYGILGTILGGRLGYVLFYKFGDYLAAPWKVFYVWEGGMSFHGGFLGVVIAMIWFARRRRQDWLRITDFIAPLVPLGLAAGRMGNFINAELWGRPAQVPWAMVFPDVDPAARHPSQLYEFALEGVALFVILWGGLVASTLAAGGTLNPVQHLVVAIDGAILLPVLAYAGIQLLRRKPIGYVLAGVLIVKAGLTGFTLAFTSAFAMWWDGKVVASEAFLVGIFGVMTLVALATWIPFSIAGRRPTPMQSRAEPASLE